MGSERLPEQRPRQGAREKRLQEAAQRHERRREMGEREREETLANASVLGNLAPLFVTLAAWAFLGERPGRAFLAGLTTVMIGAACLGGGSLGLGGRRPAGDALALAAAVFPQRHSPPVGAVSTGFRLPTSGNIASAARPMR